VTAPSLVSDHGAVSAVVSSPTRPGRRPWMAVLVSLLLAAVTVVGLADPASAHATVIATTPVDGQSVPGSPPEFTVSFTEPVDVQLGGLSVLDREGTRVDAGDTAVEDGGTLLRVPLEPDLAEGTYVGTWRVVSADGHPISGSVLFAVGTVVDPSGLDALTARTDPGWEVTGTVARFVTFTAALLAAGLAFFLAFLHDQRRDRWRMVPVVRLATVIGLLGVLGTIAAQAALATGDGLDAVTDIEVLRTLLTESLGWSSVVLLVGLALVHLSTDTQRLLVAQGCAFYGWLAVSVAFVLWGHATEAPYRWLSVVSNGAHVATAALWFGGLVGMAMVLGLRRAPLSGAPDPDLPARPLDDARMHTGIDEGADPADTAATTGGTAVATELRTDVAARRDLLVSTGTVLARFSTAAGVSLVGLLLAGVAMTWIQSGGSPSALWSTTYGRLVLSKVVLVAAAGALALYNRRRLVPALTAGVRDDGPDLDDEGTGAGWRSLRRNLVVEIVVLVAVLGLTAVLVNVTPARTAVAEAGAVVTLEGPAGDGTVEMSVTPARAGTNTLRVQYYDAAGDPLDIANGLRAEFSLPDAGLGPIDREVVKVGPGSFVVQGSELSIPGTWEIALAVRPSDFREVRTPFTVEIR
jgi:copper transport protein